MTRTCTHLNTHNTGEQVDTHASGSLMQRTERWSLLWFARVALLWCAASAVAGLVLALWGR